MEYTAWKTKEHWKPTAFKKKNKKHGNLIIAHVGCVKFTLKAYGFPNFSKA